MTKHIQILLLLITLASCDCMMDQYGIVLDADTRKPISGAKIAIAQWNEISNDQGEFEFHIVTGICPDRIISIEAEGYKPFQMEVIEEDDLLTYLVSSDYDYHDYEKPIPSKFNKKIKENGSYFDLFSTQFEAKHPDSIIFLLSKKKQGM